MSTMFTTMGLATVAAIFMMMVPIALLVALQVWLCRKGKRGLGLILPVLSLALSLVLCLSMGAYSVVGVGGSEQLAPDGTVIEYHEEYHRTALTPGAAATIAAVFLISNIPTVVLGGIWLHYKNKREWKEDLKRMNIQDLE